MFDKLELRSSEVVELKELEERLERNDFRRILDPHYSACLQLKTVGNEAMVIKTAPNPFYSNAWPLKIILNPSHWLNFDSLKQDLSKICNPNELEITRIDHAVDLEMPISEVRKMLFIKFKASSHDYYESVMKDRGRLTGFFIGKKPESYCVYDKGYLLKKNNLVRSKSAQQGILTRIELRQFNKKVVSPNFSNLNFYFDNNPFENVSFFELRTVGDNKKAKVLENQIHEHGAIAARHLLNRKNNFSRDFSNLLVPSPLNQEFKRIYQSNLEKFFN